MARHKRTSKESSTYTSEYERKLLVLEFLLGERSGGTANYIRTHTLKLRSQDGTKFQIELLAPMVEQNWVDKTVTDLGGDNSQITYKISSEGIKVIETIKDLKNNNNPLAKLGIFDQLF